MIPGGPLDGDDNRISLTQISGVTSLPISIDNISPPIIDLNRFLPFYIFSLHFKNFIVRKGNARIFFDYDHFLMNPEGLFRSSYSHFNVVKNNHDNLKIKIKKKKGKKIKYRIEIKER